MRHSLETRREYLIIMHQKNPVSKPVLTLFGYMVTCRGLGGGYVLNVPPPYLHPVSKRVVPVDSIAILDEYNRNLHS